MKHIIVFDYQEIEKLLKKRVEEMGYVHKYNIDIPDEIHIEIEKPDNMLIVNEGLGEVHYKPKPQTNKEDYEPPPAPKRRANVTDEGALMEDSLNRALRDFSVGAKIEATVLKHRTESYYNNSLSDKLEPFNAMMFHNILSRYRQKGTLTHLDRGFWRLEHLPR